MAGRRVVVALGIVIAAAIAMAPRRRRPRPVAPPAAVEPPRTVARAALHDVAPRVPLPPLRRALRTSGPARITGIVREHGGAVAGATIWTMRLPQPGHAPNGIEGGEEGPLTDAGGRFSLDDLPPGELAIWAVHEGRASALVQPLSLAAGEKIDGLELELTGSSVAEGVVVDERGERTSAEVTVSVLGIELGRVDVSDEAPFHFESLPDEPITLVASAPSEDEDVADRGAKVTMDHTSATIVLRLHAMPHALVVEVVDDAGTTDSGAFVSVSATDDVQCAVTGAAGLASFSHRAGTVSIVANDDARELSTDPVEVELADGEERTVRVVLRPTTCASGRVFDSSGAAATGLVELSTPSSTLTKLVLLEAGTYRFCIGRASTYALHWTPLPQPRNPGAVYGDVRLDVDLVPGRTTLRDVYLPPQRRVQVFLVDEEGAPAQGHVQIESGNGESSAGFLPTDERGAVVMNVIGPVQLRAVTPSAQSEPTRAPDGGGDVTLALASFGDVAVLLRGAPHGTVVRCGTQPWRPLAPTALANLACHPGDTLEAMAGSEQRRFSVPVDLDETSYAELRWD